VEAGSRRAGEQPHRRRRRLDLLTPRVGLDGAGPGFGRALGFLGLASWAMPVLQLILVIRHFKMQICLLGLLCTSLAILAGPAQLFP
jgi:hypothetical protein